MVDLSLIRAPLFVPAHRQDRFAKAAASGADGLILDLEDAVPAAEKDAARAALAVDFTTLPVLVRVNARGTSWHEADLRAVKALRPAGVILPKTASAQDVAMLRQATGLPVLALIESAEGLAAARSIISAHFSPIMMVGPFRLPLVTCGMMEESATRRASMPITRHSGSTTAIGSSTAPILQVPQGW